MISLPSGTAHPISILILQRFVPNQKVIFPANISDDGFIHLVPADADTFFSYYPAEAENRDIRVPPPMSTTIFPSGPLISSPAPKAAA
jgi:hypothetical protein